MSKIFVIPSPGIRIPDPATPKGAKSSVAMIPPEGKFVDSSPFWTRREREGDVAITSGPANVSAGAKSAKAGE
jgi:hypothetical protein